MSAAATAAGYLYASGRLRGRAAREQEEATQHAQERKPEKPVRKEVRVAVMSPREEGTQQAARPAKKTPRIEYRTRKRWSPE